MKKFLLNFFVSCLLFPFPVFSQEDLSLEKAIMLTLKNNYGISISRNEALKSKNENTLGNAGFMPQVNALAGVSFSNNNTKQEYSNGQEVNKNSAASSNFNAGIGLTWTLFDGMKMFVTSNKLKIMVEQSELQTRLTIEQSLYEIMSAYYEAARLNLLIRSSEESLSFYKEREKIAKAKFEIGSGSKQELLQTQVDKNNILASLLQNQAAFENAMANLNLIMGIPSETLFNIQDSISLTSTYSKDELFKSVISRNIDLLMAEKSIQVARYSIREYESQRFPKIGLSANYNFGRSENKAGFVLLNQNLGYSAGVNLNWNLFNGFNTNRQIKNARLTWTNASEQFNGTKASVNTRLLQAWKQFEMDKQLFNLEEENMRLARENVMIALQRFKLGASNILELKAAQNSFETAAIRLITARYEARIAEIKLMKLNGDLIR